MSTPYRADFWDREQMMSADPFGGKGIRVLFDKELDHDSVERLIKDRYGDAPFISWGTLAWVDGGSIPQATEEVSAGL